MKVFCFDLDDTLCKEIDFLKSAYREIVKYALGLVSNSVTYDDAYNGMLDAYYSGQNAFHSLNSILGCDIDVSEYLNIYRNHKPDIALSDEVICLLSNLKNDGQIIGIITDGRSIQQRNKIQALGLNEFIEDKNIVISEEFGSEKPSKRNFEYFMNLYPDAESFTYVGDNVKKDFLAPNSLGWKSVCLLDDGRNIHKQQFDLPPEFLPTVRVISLKDAFVNY